MRTPFLMILAALSLSPFMACSKASPTLTSPSVSGYSPAAAYSRASAPRTTKAVSAASVSRTAGKTTVQVDSAPEQRATYSNEDLSSSVAEQGSSQYQDNWE
ncbi:hypothetical protein COW36_24715 [bacterium (Candidatus Blackallbacteria) CG17_big_fil_post_rev_8_21_14_2_50_48_46]|uniref:Uncharacterized protein n=1 Tax=bacterium (Candidatus Blackallbacteria) CG17_big_fil_post_rev_8_21_14_2_50_48_46 TaxID=2014261 RepID=A0A2M7FXB2_9BACT|nr:MAG: hypothetical protein COW64_19655 [bacterium (Candidatus Blackallbacteria) CG18_big_fil_WC_8_21_14_2_50_49_26]PIW13871.1 MAG: hypothetical protein COW36_24715 [bacterium (Candidatus Blackallbacteria) CG17_big_fil_post_rev_8_21_14_2_50_48_46]PIW45097.1 MAG: hypothetical protein COW20_22345 [bacterium (Candidatus Blackallbacteria) CG13_big_fil_rev_8_21_14_2_50_49_14]